MDVLIRGLDPIVVQKLDEQAKNKQLSRNEYIKSLLINLAHRPFVRDIQNESSLQFKKVVDALVKVNDRIENLEISFERLYLFNVILQSGMDLEDVNEVLDNFIVEKD